MQSNPEHTLFYLEHAHCLYKRIKKTCMKKIMAFLYSSNKNNKTNYNDLYNHYIIRIESLFAYTHTLESN